MKQYVFRKHNKFPKRLRKTAGVVIIFAGFVILLYFFFPLISYQIFFGGADALQTPVPKYAVVGQSSLTSLIAQGVSHLTTDYNDARNWYPTVHASNTASVPVYSLSIPKLKIADAQVSTVDYDLSKHLIQYAGSSIPGQNGTAIIFGHSTLPQWFDPKNYKAIFATLHLIKEGDEIITRVNGVTYTYKIFSITITSPEDTNIFAQSYNHPYLTIITCTPPGTVWKRLIVRASLEDMGKPAALISTKKSLLAGSFTY